MKVYGLIGNPLSHSFSQKYFTEKFIQKNLSNCVYLNFETPDLDREVINLKNNFDLCGLNITIPYKSKIISFLDEVSAECKEIGACNCIKIANKKWSGFNTDVTGFEETFKPHLKGIHKKALILGTGGSSKAIAYVLKKLGISYLFVSRTNSLQNSVIGYGNITAAMLHEFNIIINTTPAGMFPHMDVAPELPYQFISENHYFFDLIYNPAKTLFLSKAEEKGAVIENGEQMLSIQAEESWKIWNQI